MGMAGSGGVLPHWLVLDDCLRGWLREDLGRQDWSADAIASDCGSGDRVGEAVWLAKEAGTIAGLTVAARVMTLLDRDIEVSLAVEDGAVVGAGTILGRLRGPVRSLLTGERTALNLLMRLSGVATLTREYVAQVADLPTRLVDTRKTTPGLRILEKYAMRLGGAVNHRMGLDDAAMVKDNHIAAAGGIAAAVAAVRSIAPFPLSIEVETETLAQVEAAIAAGADIIMLDNMPLAEMRRAVLRIREVGPGMAIEASGNITLETIRAVAETGVDYISTSAMVTRSRWLDLSMRMV